MLHAAPPAWVMLAYLVSGICFILALRGLSSPATSRRGNRLGIFGMGVAVFTTLLRLKNHHLAKLSNRGRAVNFERLLGEILGGIADFPRHLSLPDQGRFSLGYYNQRQDFFNKSTQSDESTQGESK